MPPRKYNYRRKNYREKKVYPPRSRWQNYGNAINQLGKDVSSLKNLINVEFKAKDVSTGTITVNNVGTSYLLNGLQRGDTLDSREGRQVRGKSLEMRFLQSISTSAVNTQMRYILVIDKQANAASPTFNDILTSTSVTAARNLDNRKRFVVLKDKQITLRDNNTSELFFKWYIPIDCKTVYNASNVGDISDIETNSIWLFMFSSETTNLPVTNIQSRYRFIDN